MNKSENINELAAALAKAQGKITGALKDSSNTFFKSNYADLASCWEAARAPLSDNGLCVIQTSSTNEQGVVIDTMLAHSSGQWVSDSIVLTPKDDSPQAIGSCITYGRRYGLTAIVGIAQVDDDGNAASGRDKDDSGRPSGWRAQDTRKVTEYKNRILGLVGDGKDLHAVDVWKEVKDDHEFATALWASLSKPVQSMIKKGMADEAVQSV